MPRPVALVLPSTDCQSKRTASLSNSLVSLVRSLRLEVREGQTATIEKVVSLYTSRDPAISEPGRAAADAVEHAGTFDTLLASHAAAWHRLWSRFQFDVGDTHADKVLRLHAFHTLQTLSRHTMELDVGVPRAGSTARGTAGTCSGTMCSSCRF